MAYLAILLNMDYANFPFLKIYMLINIATAKIRIIVFH
jgi:hypothetical protein